MINLRATTAADAQAKEAHIQKLIDSGITTTNLGKLSRVLDLVNGDVNTAVVKIERVIENPLVKNILKQVF